MNCIKCGKELINSAVCACDKIKLEEKLMGKKYRVKKDFWVFKKDVTMDFIFPISWVVEKLIKDGYIEEVKKEKPMEQKKYRLKKDLPDCKVGTIFISLGSAGNFYGNDNQSVVIENKIVESNPDWFEEVKEDTLKESILYKYINTDYYGKIINEITDWHNKEVIKQKIELLKWAIQFVDNPKDRVTINNKISELQKEITDGEKV